MASCYMGQHGMARTAVGWWAMESTGLQLYGLWGEMQEKWEG